MEMVLSGATGLVGLCCLLACFYFSWILARKAPSRSTKLFLRLVLLATGLMVGIVVLYLALTGLSFASVLTEEAWLVVSGLLVPIHLLERVVWIAAAGALLAFAIGEKRKSGRRRVQR